MKSELAIKRDQWLASEEGKKCLDASSLFMSAGYEIYLKNRLEIAFLAGAQAEREIKQEQ